MKKILRLKLAQDVLRRGHRVHVSVITNSMRPLIHAGDYISVSPVELDRLCVGEIILFRRGDIGVVHRIIEVSRNDDHSLAFLTTKGDLSARADKPIFPGDVLGVVDSVTHNDTTFDLSLWYFKIISALLGRVSRIFGHAVFFRDFGNRVLRIYRKSRSS